MKNINEKNKTLEDLKEESLLLWFANNVIIRSILFALCLEDKKLCNWKGETRNTHFRVSSLKT